MKIDNPAGLSDTAVNMLARAGINPLGFVRVKELKPLLGVPLGVSTVWKKCAATPPEFPQPYKLPGATCWKVAEVMAWLEQQAKSAQAGDANQGAKLTAARLEKRRQDAARTGGGKS